MNQVLPAATAPLLALAPSALAASTPDSCHTLLHVLYNPFRMYFHLLRVFAAVLLAVAIAGAQDTTQQPTAKTQPRLGDSAGAPSSAPFSIAVAENLLSRLRDGFDGQDRTRTLALFDRERMPDYSRFAGDISLMFDRYDPVRVQYQIVQTVNEPERHVATVEFSLELTLATYTQPPIRRTQQLLFYFQPAGKKWKIADVQPRRIFDPF